MFDSKDGIMYPGMLTNCVLQFHVSGITKVTSPFVAVAGMARATVPLAVEFERQAADSWAERQLEIICVVSILYIVRGGDVQQNNVHLLKPLTVSRAEKAPVGTCSILLVVVLAVGEQLV